MTEPMIEPAICIRTGRCMFPDRDYYRARIVSPTNGRYSIFNIPPEDYARHWDLEGRSTAPGSPTDALYRRGLGW